MFVLVFCIANWKWGRCPNQGSSALARDSECFVPFEMSHGGVADGRSPLNSEAGEVISLVSCSLHLKVETPGNVPSFLQQSAVSPLVVTGSPGLNLPSDCHWHPSAGTAGPPNCGSSGMFCLRNHLEASLEQLPTSSRSGLFLM